MDPLNHVGDDKETKVTLHKLCINRSPTYDASTLHRFAHRSKHRTCKKRVVWIMKIEEK